MLTGVNFNGFIIAGAFFFCAGAILANQVLSEKSAKIKPCEIKVLHRNSRVCDTIWCKRKPKKNCHVIRLLQRREITKRKQHVQSFLSVWHKRLLCATPGMNDMKENGRQSNLQLVFLQTILLKGALSRYFSVFRENL